MENRCDDLMNKLPEYLEGSLKPNEVNEFEQQISDCPEILKEIESHRLLEGLLINHEGLPVPESTDEFFYNHLDKAREKKNNTFQLWQMAAAVALLLVGGLIGAKIASGVDKESDIITLKEDVKQMKQMLVSAMLEEHSAMDRIKAVSYTEEMISPDLGVINVLVKSLTSDKSPNVRIAAANALEKWNSVPVVRAELVKAMEYQNEPIVQITLINILINMGEKDAVKPFRKIVEDESIEEIVRKQAQIGIEVLI